MTTSSCLTLNDEQRERLQFWDRTRINHKMVITLRADSTVLLDSNQRIERLMRFINMTAKSGFVNVQPLIEELASLSGLDPAMIVRAPEPSGPEPPNVSLRVSGAVDLRDPLVLAMFVKSQQAPSQEELAVAQKMIQASGGVIRLQDRRDVDPNYDVRGEGDPPPGVGEPPLEDTNPDWTTPPVVNKRRDGGDVDASIG